MATKPVAGKEGVEAGEGPAVHRIRITLTSKNVKNLEKGEGVRRRLSVRVVGRMRVQTPESCAELHQFVLCSVR